MLLPVQVESGRKRRPDVTIALLMLNAAAYVAAAAQASHQTGSFWHNLLALPASVVERWALLPARPTPLSFLTSSWIHLDIVHLAGNLFFLWVFGSAAEEYLGGGQLLGIYLAGGLAAAIVQVYAAHRSPALSHLEYAGASGAILAVMSAFTVRRYRAKVRLWAVLAEISVPAWAALLAYLGWFAVVPLLSQAQGESSGYWGHIGAAAAGLVLAVCLRFGPRAAADYAFEEAARTLDAGKLREGLRQLEGLRRVAPHDSRIPLLMARAYVKVWDSGAAALHYCRAVEVELGARRIQTALEYWNEAMRASVTLSPHLALALASALDRTGKKDCSASLYEYASRSEDKRAASLARRRLNGISVKNPKLSGKP